MPELLSIGRRQPVRVLCLRPDDDVGVVLGDLSAGEHVAGPSGELVARSSIPPGHKIAVKPVAAGSHVRKYGQSIGIARADIRVGDHVHTHNLAFEFHDDTHTYRGPHTWVAPVSAERTTFKGYERPDGSVGTRNFLGIITTVNCSATVAQMIAEEVRRDGLLAEFPHIDGIVAITHSGGCGISPEGLGIDVLIRTLSGYAQHSNFAGILTLGLGCEVNQVSRLTLPAHQAVEHLTIQQAGGTMATVRAGVSAIRSLATSTIGMHRTDVSVAQLVLGLKCGGSDGYSGLTANPALGVAADLIVAAGGRAVLCETPEIYGAEHLLMDRAISSDVADSLAERVRWWRSYTAQHGVSLDNNPSPGNKVGGITTILEKSLGAIAKSGTSPLSAVYQYAEHINTAGLGFMDSPGYDPVSVTGLIAGGANLVAFTTGRGSVFGSQPVPTVKLATNTSLALRMPDDIDLNCGPIADGTRSVESLGQELYDLLLDTASGAPSKSEQLGIGHNEFVPWQLGAVL